MPYVTIADERIHYTHSRDDLGGQRPALLLVHGAGGSTQHWPSALRRLPGYNVYALDLPGHGRSRGSGRNEVAAYREVLREFLQALKLTSVVLGGHSMGGAIAQDFALHYPKRLEGLVLVGTGAKLRVAPAILSGLRSDFVATSRMLTNFAHGSRPGEQMKRQFLKRLLENDPVVVYNDFLACDGFDLRANLGSIRVPSLIICGVEDQLTPPHYSDYLAANLPNARLVLVPDSGHMVMLEAAVRVAGEVEGFLGNLGQARRDGAGQAVVAEE